MLFAPHYARAEPCRCVADAVSVRARPSEQAPAISQLVFGEGFALIDQTGDWAWGRCMYDDYVGYLPASALGPLPEPTHRIAVPLALVFANPDIKAPIVRSLPIGAQFQAEEEDDYLRTADGYVHARHAKPLGERAADPVAVAELLLGQPYRWGGRGADGIDCSGLVQRALELAGVAAPRDSDMQRDGLGELLEEHAPLQRGDIVFFPGHVGLMVDDERIIHANAHWMSTVIEPLQDVIARLRPLHDEPLVARRRVTA